MGSPIGVVRAAFTGVALLGAAAAPAFARPVDAPPAVELLVLRGAADSFVDVQIPRPFTPLDSEATVTTAGTYGGYAIYSLPADHPAAGLVSIPAFEATGHPFGPERFSRQRELPAGSYRIYLLADGETRVRLPVAGLPAPLRLRPAAPADVDAGVLDLAHLPAADHGSARVPLELGAVNWIYMVALQVVEHHQASRMSVCSAPRGARECLIEGAGPNGTGVFPGPSLFPGYFTEMAAGAAKEGPVDLLFNVDGVGVSKALLGFYLVVHR